MKRMKKLLAAMLVFSMVIACFAATGGTSQAAEKFEVKNVIFMIGDGMGDGAIAAGRMKRATLNLDGMEKLGYLNTNNIKDELTDSAAGGTALATGVRTTNGTVGLDKDGKVVENLSEWMKQKGKKLGLVSTTYVVDATPATFAAHTSNRNNYGDVAKAMVDLGVDVILGGGTSQFDSAINGGATTGIQYAQTVGNYQYVTKKSELDDITSGKVLGLFGATAMSWPSEKKADEPYLDDLTEKTLSLLENKNGFFAMIEGGRIDGAGHNNEAGNLQDSMLEFDDAIAVALDYADTHEGTLVIVTADHETGGVSVGSTTSGPQVQFSTGDHTKDPVPYYVYGAGVEHFKGLSKNIDIAPAIKKAVTEGSTTNSGSQGSGESDEMDDSWLIALLEEEALYASSSGANASGNGAKIPPTGDNSIPMLWLALLGICGGVLLTSMVYRRKKHNCE